MRDEEREHFVVLTEGEVTTWLTAATSGSTNDAARLVACGLAGDETLRECCPHLATADLEGMQDRVQAAPCPDRFHYPWIVVDLTASAQPWHQALRDGLDRVDPRKRGLVLRYRADWEPCAAAEITTPSRCGLQTWFAFVQYVRATLRNVPPSRVLITQPVDAMVLTDALEQHVTATAVFADLPVAAPRPLRQRRQPAGDWLAMLRWLAERGQATSTPTGAPPSGTTADELIAGMAATFVPPDDDVLKQRVRAMHRRGMVLPASADAFASFLCDGEGLRRLPKPRTDHVTWRDVDLTERLPDAAPRRVLYSCLHLLGDALNATPILRQHRRQHPDDHITFLVPDEPYAQIFEWCPDVDRLTYVNSGGNHDLVFGSTRQFVESTEYVRQFDEHHVLDIHEVAADATIRTRQLHMAEGYAHRLGRTLDSRRPSIDVGMARAAGPSTQPAGRYAVFARHSVSGQSGPEHEATKRWAEAKWRHLARRLRRELGLTVVSIGTPAERPFGAKGMIDMHDLSIHEVAGLLAGAAVLICIDNGIFHVGQAIGCPIVHLTPHWLGAGWTAMCPEVPGRDLVTRLKSLTTATVFHATADLLAGIEADASPSPPAFSSEC